MSEQTQETQEQTQETQTSQEQTSLLSTQTDDGSVALTEGEWLLTPTMKGVGDKPEWYKTEKYKTVQDQAEAYNALESKFGSFAGAPESYELNVPEGLEGEFDDDDPLLAGAREMAKEMGMDQTGFDKMVSLYLSNSIETPEDQQSAMATQLVEVLGPKHEQRISQVSGALSNLLDADTYKEIAPFANTPQAIRLVEAVILASAPKVPPVDGGANPEGVTKARLNEMRAEVIQDGPNKGELRWHKDPDFRKQIGDYAKALLGDD